MEVTWTVERNEQLKMLFELRYSTQRIADELGNGISRNAVIGRLHRMGLRSKQLGIEPAVRKDRKKPAIRIVAVNGNSNQMRLADEPKSVALPTLRCVEVEPRNLTLLELEDGDCRWSMSDESPHVFCGNPIVEGARQPYCFKHQEINRAEPTERSRLHISRMEVA